MQVARQPDRRERTHQQRRHHAHIHVSSPRVEQARRRAQNGSAEDACAHQPAGIPPVQKVQQRTQRRSRADRSERNAQAHGEPRGEGEHALVTLRESHQGPGEDMPGVIRKEPRGHQPKHGQQRYSNGPLQKGVLNLRGAPAQVSEKEKAQRQARRRARRELFQYWEIHKPSPVETDARDDLRGERKGQAGPYSLRGCQPSYKEEKRGQHGPAANSRQAEQQPDTQPEGRDQEKAQCCFPPRSGSAAPRSAFCRDGGDASKMLRPFIVSGRAIPNSARTVGAISVRAGFSVWILRLLKTTPGTFVKSIQWSPLHGWVLSSITVAGMPPSTLSQPTRYSRLYPTMRSGP